jgi:hypothetical protein
MGEAKHRNTLSTSEVGDRISTADNLIHAGAKDKHGPTIKRGIELYKNIGHPIHHILAVARHIVKEAQASSIKK